MMKHTLLCASLLATSMFVSADTNDAPNAPISYSRIDTNKALAIPAPAPQGGVASSYDSNVITVRPDKLVEVPISVKDTNFLVCKNGVIADRTFSEEKPLIFKKSNDSASAYLKTSALKDQVSQKVLYYTEDIDLYVVCDGQVYSMMLKPQMRTPTRIILDGGRGKQIQANVAKFSGMAKEEVIVDILDKIHAERGNLPPVFHVTKSNLNEKWQPVTDKTNARLREKVKLEGSGLTVYVYQFYTRLGDALHEMDVVNAQLKSGVFAVRLYNHTPKKDSTFLGYVATWEVL